MVSDARARRAVLLFLVLVTIVVLVRAAATAQGANGAEAPAGRAAVPAPAAPEGARALSWSIVEQGDILTAGKPASRTLSPRLSPVNWR